MSLLQIFYVSSLYIFQGWTSNNDIQSGPVCLPNIVTYSLSDLRNRVYKDEMKQYPLER